MPYGSTKLAKVVVVQANCKLTVANALVTKLIAVGCKELSALAKAWLNHCHMTPLSKTNKARTAALRA